MRSNRQFFKRRNSHTEDSVYLYHSENKDLYNEVLEKFNQSDCIFNRNLMAYLEDRERSDDSFYSKHVLSCPSCQAKAKEYRNIQNRIGQAIPDKQMGDELLSMIKADIKEAEELFNQDPSELEKINILATFKSSLVEFFKGFFTSREIALGFLLACSFVLAALLIN